MPDRFAPVPSSPNCVSSRADPADRQHYIEPLQTTDLDAARQALLAQPRTELVEEDGDYLRFVCTTRFLRFKDDVELELDPDAGVVHVRSASRVGYGDMGVNRRRVEALRSELGA